jgi:hypothetical protein
MNEKLNKSDKIKTLQKKLVIKKKEIFKLKNRIDNLLLEKEELITNFEKTTNILIEKLKDLSKEKKTEKFEIRPKTSLLLKNIFQERENKENIENYENMKPSFKKKLFSEIEIGKGIESKSQIFHSSKKDLNQIEKLDNELCQEQSYFEEKKNKDTVDFSKCLNCEESFENKQIYEHFLNCFRTLKKCIYCGDLKLKNEYTNHLKNFLDDETIILILKSNNLKKLRLCLDHNFDINKIIENKKSKFISYPPFRNRV